MTKTLIFCSSLPDAHHYYREAKKRGEAVVASSSLKYDDTAHLYECWQWLPSIHADDFCEQLQAIIQQHGITHIYCPHHIVHEYLQQLKESVLGDVFLIGQTSLVEQTDALVELQKRAEEVNRWQEAVCEKPACDWFRTAARWRYAEQTYGQAAGAKLASMMAIAPLVSEGDVVEIGVWWGKTGALLCLLARDYAFGPVLCVDPWQAAPTVQEEAAFRKKIIGMECDWQKVFEGFLVNIATVAMPDCFNYLRMTSLEAAEHYRRSKVVDSSEFGCTSFKGKIALLHIDGNHDYASVAEDYAAWRPELMTGGWVILDDYVWPHGDGPKRLGDEILEHEKRYIRRSFVSGNALFIHYGAR